MSDRILYTALVGNNGDRLHDDVFTQPGTRLVCYTDRNVKSDVWEIRKPVVTLSSPRLTARWHKLHSHLLFPDSLTIWQDACLVASADLSPLFTLCNDHVVSTFRHPQRQCIYRELIACIRLRKDNPVVMRKQIEEMQKQGYPHNYGLAETACVVRSPAAAVLNAAWWDWVGTRSWRDQLSFNFCLWTLNMEHGIVAGSRNQSPWFRYVKHRKQ